jgi:hypothetical protein
MAKNHQNISMITMLSIYINNNPTREEGIQH